MIAYLGIENLNLNDAQKRTFVNALKELGHCSRIFKAIRSSGITENQKACLLDVLHRNTNKAYMRRFIQKVERQARLYEENPDDNPPPDMTPLTGAQKRALSDLYDEIPSTSPHRIVHWRTRLDGDAIILAGHFTDDNLTVNGIKGFLADTFGIDADTIGHSVSHVTFDELPTPVVTYSRGGTDYIRFALFGGKDASYEEAGAEVRAYIAANRNEWEPPEEV